MRLGLRTAGAGRAVTINAVGAILNLRFTATGGALPVSLESVRLNDAAGRDFVTSALQKQIEITPPYRVYLPLVTR